MIRRTIILAAILAAAVPATLSAKPVSDKDVQSGKVVRDPSQGYILVSGAERSFGVFLRVPDEATWTEWAADRDMAMAKAQRRYASDLKQWNQQAEIARQQKTPLPERPVAPTYASLNVVPAELRDMESFGPMNAFGKDAAGFSYLNAVKPGTYVWYGPVMAMPNGGGMGSCTCLGSVRFEVKPGVVTDLGNSLVSLPQWSELKDVQRMQQASINAKRVAAGKPPLPTFAPLATRYGLPPALSAWPSAQAVLQASPKMNNYFGLTVSRLAPIPGVLAYRRDVVVDARSGQEVPSPTLMSRQRIKN